ncbi:cupredoxin domain-containing protein [Colwellia sp. 75C3]|uniref:cupredoxin domain-containing protein n=1 Tax=Colwellia sp. 75C3 TaxID=888425 RepID=UPI003FA4B070
MSYILLMASYNVFAQRQEFSITLKDHLFYPAEMTIPANKKIKLIIDNQDDSVEEFDSFSLNREKVLFPKQKATIYIGPLSPGRYDFFGEYHPDSARGVIIVSEADLPIPAIKEVDNAN